MTQVNKESFLRSFLPQMRLDKAVFKKIYGYELTWPGFAEIALTRLENLGCSRAREYYETVQAEINQEWNEIYKRVAVWYGKQYEDGKAVSKSRKQQEVERLKADLQQKSDKELLTLLQNLKQIGA